MFPRSYFPAGAFAPRYFPPVVHVVPPAPPEHHGGSRQRWRKTSVVREWLIEQEDAELMFFLE